MVSHQRNIKSNQSNRRAIVMEDTKYIVIKNGRKMDFRPRSIDAVIELIRRLEVGIDRATQHSPYTIGISHESN